MSEPVILTNVCLVTDGQERILLQERTDTNQTCWTIPGGHIEPGESFVRSVVREVREETGLTVENPVLRAMKQFQTSRNERYLIFCYRADRFHGTLRGSEEGRVAWVERERLSGMKTISDLQEIIDLIESEEKSEYYLADGQLELL